MRKTRIFVEQKLHVVTVLAEEASHHILRVLRLRLGDPLVLFDGCGGEYDAEISKLDKRHVEVHINQYRDTDTESTLRLTLIQGISRGQKMDFILQKAVELGVGRIVPVMTEYGNVRLDEKRQQKRIEHWHGIILGACEQCGRNTIPELLAPMSLDEHFAIDAGVDGGITRIVLHPGAGESLSKLALMMRSCCW